MSPIVWLRVKATGPLASRNPIPSPRVRAAHARLGLPTDSAQLVRTTLEGRSLVVFERNAARMRDLDAASFAEHTLVGWVVEENGPKAVELMLLPADGQTRGLVGATLDGEFDPSLATADGKTFWVVTNRWPERNPGDWPGVVVRKLTVP